jgi:hypothetical protein
MKTHSVYKFISKTPGGYTLTLTQLLQHLALAVLEIKDYIIIPVTKDVKAVFYILEYNWKEVASKSVVF